MKIILAIDALEYNLVEKFNFLNLKNKFFGKTDISDFSQPRTMVLWSSFLTGENKEEEVLIEGNKEMWNKTWTIEDTFLKNFENPAVIDLPGFSYDLKSHEHSRKLLKKFFEAEDKEKENIRKEYNKQAFNHHNKIKKKFFNALNKNHDLVIGYFSVIDVIGHLSFGNETLMKMLYKELNEIAEFSKNKGEVLILSDHGMKKIGVFGDHSNYGFWSFKSDLKKPKITDFFDIISSWQ